MSVFSMARTPGLDLNPTTLAQRANSFATAAEDCHPVTLLLHRDAAGMHGMVLADGPRDAVHRLAVNLAHSVGARAEADVLPDSLVETTHFARARFRSGASVARESVLGTDPTEMARRLEVSLGTGDWVAISMRPPTRREGNWHQRWLERRLSAVVPSHPSMSPAAQVISIWAGSSSAGQARSLIRNTSAAMMGFDLQVVGRRVGRLRAVVPLLLGAVVALVAGRLLDTMVSANVGGVSTGHVGSLIESALDAVGLVVAGVLLGRIVVGLLAPGSSRFAFLARRLRAAMGTGEFPTPPRRLRAPRAPTDARNANAEGRGERKARPGDYPLASASFQTAPVIFVGLVAPYAGAASGDTGARVRQVPPRLSVRIGPLVGHDGPTPAYLPAAEAFSGVAILGRAGSGKTQMVRSLFGWACMDRAAPSGIPGAPGRLNTLIAFESKGGGIAPYRRWAEATGTKLAVIDLADPTTFAIDLFATPGTVAQRAEAFANALRYSFDEGSIQDRSFNVLHRVYTAALGVDADRSVLRLLPDIDHGGSVNYFANVLVGNTGDARALQLATAVIGAARAPGAGEPMRLAAESLIPLFENRSESSRRSLVEAAQNKVAQLHSLDQWFAPSRPKVTWDQVLEARGDTHRAVLVNTGATVGGVLVEAKLTAIMSSLLMFTLRSAIMRNCVEWQDHGRSVSIFADELSLLAGSSPEVVSWLKDQGRSFGVRATLATQRPEQLPRAVRSVLLNFSTLVTFNQENVATAGEVAVELTGASEPVEGNEVLHLPQWHAMIRSYADGVRQEPYVAAMANFEDDVAAAITAQGYHIDASSGAPPAGEGGTPGMGTNQTAGDPVLPEHIQPAPAPSMGVAQQMTGDRGADTVPPEDPDVMADLGQW